MQPLTIDLELATRAHMGTSFCPEKRGEQRQADFKAIQEQDYATFLRVCKTDEHKAILDSEWPSYASRLKHYYELYLGRLAACLSPMITGPARFPTGRNAKANDSAQKSYETMDEFRRRANKAICKKIRPDLEDIRNGDADAVERLEAKLKAAEQSQETMKAVNKIIRQKSLTKEEKQAKIQEAGLSEPHAKEILEPDFMGHVGFPGYALTNNNANIRRMRQRLEHLRKAKQTEDFEVQGKDDIKIEVSNRDNRIRMYFPGKPDAETRTSLKRNGFRWARSLGCWQAYINTRSIEYVKLYKEDKEDE